MNLPNQITVARLLLAVVLFVLLETVCRGQGGAIWYVAFGLYLASIIGDAVDGYVARSRGEVTAFGRIADPFADKVVICGVLVLTQNIPQTAALVPSWIVLLVIAREFLVSGLRSFLESRGTRFGARWEGKAKLMVQAAYCGAVLFYPGDEFRAIWWIARITMWGTAALSVYSTVTYSLRAREALVGADV